MKIYTKINKNLDLRRFGKNAYINDINSARKEGQEEGGGGDSTPTEFYIKFKAENFGLRNADYVPDTVDRSKGYMLDEIFDISGDVLERFIKAQEDARDALISDGYSLEYLAGKMGCHYNYDGNPDSQLQNGLFGYVSYESGNIGSMDGSYPVITTAFTKHDGQHIAKTLIQIEGTNLKGYSWTPPDIIFEKNDEDGKWYIVYAN